MSENENNGNDVEETNAAPSSEEQASSSLEVQTSSLEEQTSSPEEQTSSIAPAPIDENEEEPTQAYRVTLPAFQGPLDLLLHLIRKHEVDIYDIPIILITEQYNAYLDAMEQLDLDIAADYIYMAALLINIKSRMLLPRDENADEQADDPRKELVDRLIEYQRFKAVAESFAELDVVRMGMWPRPRVPVPGSEEPNEIDMSDVGLFDLIDAFRTALARYRQNHPQAIELQRVVHKVSDKMRELYVKVREKSPIRLQWFIEGRDRNELIAVFLGMLELVRLGGISLKQGDIFGDILIHPTQTEIDEATFALFDNS
ncbi:MAG: segregation and condensation protein A [Thermoanaerobaculia bacterium]